MRMILSLLWRECRPFLAALSAGVLNALSHIGLLAAGAYLLSLAALNPSPGAIALPVAGVRFFGLARAVSRYAERYVSHSVTFRLLRDIRVMVYAAVERRPKGKPGLSDAYSRLVADIDTLQVVFLRVILPLAVGVAVLTVLSVCFLLWLPDGVWVLWICFGIYAFAIPSFVGNQPDGEAREKLVGIVSDSMAGMDEILVFRRVEQQKKAVLEAASSYGKLRMQFSQRTAAANAAGTFVLYAALCLIAALATAEVGKGLPTIYVAPLVFAAGAGLETARELPAIRLFASEAWAAARRLSPLLTASVTNSKNDMAETSELTVKSLSFRYPGTDRNVLDKVSFDLPPGKKIAIVGTSGSGKSTLISLLLGLVNYENGQIQLGGKDLSTLSDDTVREMITAVTQESHLFQATLKDNILLARPAANEAEWRAAANAAGLTPVAEKLPEGFLSIPGWNGRTLSGGESRRVALARALLRNKAPILLLDEPTEGLDAIAARALMSRLLAESDGRSILLVTHHLQGLSGFDEILVFDQGLIVERGNWRSLLDKQGLFYRLWHLEWDNVPNCLG